MIQILLMLKVFLNSRDSEADDLFCSASSCSEHNLSFSYNLFSLGVWPV